MPRVEYLAFQQYPEVRGVFVGGCVDRGDGSSFRAKAHAHTKEPNKGWICVRSAKRLYVPGTDRPSKLMLHELAHVLTGHGHDDVWRKKVRVLGGSINRWETKEYHRQRRGVVTMTAAQKKELVERNDKAIARLRARREVRELRRQHKKVTPELLEQAGWGRQEQPKTKVRVAEIPASARTRSTRLGGRISFKELKAAVKEKWPAIKGLADATYEELAGLLRHGDQDPVLLSKLSSTWHDRSRARHEAWLKGDTASAKAARERRKRPLTNVS